VIAIVFPRSPRCWNFGDADPEVTAHGATTKITKLTRITKKKSQEIFVIFVIFVNGRAT
jgi:hypothetical protein